MQLQPRSVLTCVMRSWAQWCHENLLPFPRLIRDLRFGLVVIRASIRYEREFSLFSADDFVVRTNINVMQKRHVIVGDLHYMNGNERFLRAEIVTRPVSLTGDGSLAAVPTRVEGRILEMFEPDEIFDHAPERVVRKALSALDPAALVAETQRSFRLHRHDAEVADQWSYIEIAANAASAREAMVLDAEPALRDELRPAIATPIRAIDIEINRPLFLFDTAQIITRAYRVPDGLTFVHVFRSQLGGAHDHATIVEHLGTN
jgi:acyl-CoA thioesterase FadM